MTKNKSALIRKMASSNLAAFFKSARLFFLTTKRKRYHLKTKKLFSCNYPLMVGMSRFFSLDILSRWTFFHGFFLPDDKRIGSCSN